MKRNLLIGFIGTLVGSLLLLVTIGVTPTLSAQYKYTTSDGYTVWHLDVNGGCSRDYQFFDLIDDTELQEMSDLQVWIAHSGSYWDHPLPGCVTEQLSSINFYVPETGHYRPIGRLHGVPGGYNIECWSINGTGGCPISDSWEENIDDPHWHFWVVSSGNWPACADYCLTVYWIEFRAKVGFKVLEHTPEADDRNVGLWSGVSVDFSGGYQAATLNDNTFKLEYRNQGGAWQQVAGLLIKGQNNFSFQPNYPLKDGVRYRATVVGGQNGVISDEENPLNANVQWYFWTAVDLGAADSLDLAVFQVARNATMVSGGKPAVGRLYVRWQKHDDVFEDDQVKEMDVKASMSVEGGTYEARQTVKRPDLYSAGERMMAANTINFYHTALTSFDYMAEVVPQPNGGRYTTHRSLGSTGRSPRIEYDYYFLKDGDWLGGVPVAAQTDGLTWMTAGSQFITDQFPVMGTSFHEKGEFGIGYTFTGNFQDCSTTSLHNIMEVYCPGWNPPIAMPEWQCVYEHTKTMLGGHKFVAVTVPASLYPCATAFAADQKVFFHLSSNGANTATIAHEVGHIYGISTANSPDLWHRDASDGVEGFQVRLKINRSHAENPSRSKSLMHHVWQPTKWIDNSDYGTLLSDVASGILAPLQDPGPYLIVSGHIDTTTQGVDFSPAFLQELPNDLPSATGPYLVELLDSGGLVLASDYVTPGILVVEEKPSLNRDLSGGPLQDPNGPQYFSVSLPWNAAAHAVRVSFGSTVAGTLVRSPNAPSVDFSNLQEGEILSGVKTLNWIGSDADGPNLAYQVQFSADNGALWRPLTILSVNTTFDLDTSRLPSGSNLKLRVLVTDGFNTGYMSRTVTVSNPLRVAGVLPTWSETDVDLTTPVQALFVSSVAPVTLAGGVFQLLANGSNPVTGTVAYDAAMQMAVFTPREALLPSTSYTARVAASVQDTNGHSLGSDYTWVFTTVADTMAPLVLQTSPASGELGVPPNVLIGARFNEPINPGTVNPSSFQLLDPNGQPLSGVVTYDAAAQRATFWPAAGLAPNSTYTALLTTGVGDEAGNLLENPYQWRFTTGSTLSQGVRLAGRYEDRAVDDNGDGLYDRLTIYVDVEVLSPGTYILSGRLLSGSGEVLGWNSTSANLAAGIHTLSLSFGSLPIRGAALGGAFTLDAVYIVKTSDPSIADMKGNAYRTFAYDATRFYGLGLGPIPDQWVEKNTSREPAFNLRDYTVRPSKPLTDVTYTIEGNTDPRVGLSIGPNGEVNIHPDTNLVTTSNIWIKASDPDGNAAWDGFSIRVQDATPYDLHVTYNPTMMPKTSQEITAEVVDQWDRLWTQPVTVTFWSSVGTVNPDTVETTTGIASTTFSPGNVAGTVEVDINIYQGPYKYIYIELLFPGRLYLPLIFRQ